MFLNDVTKKDRIREIAVIYLEDLGIKHKLKKLKSSDDHKEGRPIKEVFKVPLNRLPVTVVTLQSGQQLRVPKILYELCHFLESHLDTEGIFRKEGSKVRQKEMRGTLSKGKSLEPQAHEIDVAAILKLFLRELPEPLIPHSYQDLFLRCVILDKEKRLEALLLACLLLPMEHLSTLSYLMHFFSDVHSHSKQNKMNFYNLSIVIAPNIMRSPMEVQGNKYRVEKSCLVFELLAENAPLIGVLPKQVIEAIDKVGEPEEKKKKRRSGSLTRVFNGLRKIVGNKSEEVIECNTPDLLLTPSITSNKKRKLESVGLSSKKKKDVLKKLPEGALLSTPFTPMKTPFRSTPDPKVTRKSLQSGAKASQKINGPKEKKAQWYSRSKSAKAIKTEENVNRRNSFAPKSLIERRWSAVSQVAAFKRHKKRNSLIPAPNESEISELSSSPPSDVSQQAKTNVVEPDYVRIKRSEYEEIKNKVSAIERRISMEMDLVQSEIKLNSEKDIEVQPNSNIKNVQTAYEQTLVQAKPLSPTTDHLARRLSKELKIRRNSENKIIRSPSARKIGTMRRRSRDLERQNMKLKRHESWHSTIQVIPRVNIKRGKPNTILTGLPTPSKSSGNQFICSTPLDFTSKQSSVTNKTKPDITKSQSFSDSHNYDFENCSITRWTSAEGFFGNKQAFELVDSLTNTENSRPSLVMLRNQNAGMVLAKAKLFDNLIDSDSSVSFKSDENQKPEKMITKIGDTRHGRVYHRGKVIRKEESEVCRKSPITRHVSTNRPYQMRSKISVNERMLSENNRLNSVRSAQNTKDCNKIIVPDVVPRKNAFCTANQKVVMNSKRTPNRSPKCSFKSSQTEKRTPLRVLGNMP